MVEKFPLSKEGTKKLIKKYPTPFHIYDEAAILKNAQELKDAFSWCEFKEYFAVKATPNPVILKMLKKLNFGGDCSSLAELVLCENSKITGENIMFTSNDTPVEEFKKALKLGAIINLDDISHIDFFIKNKLKFPKLICLRYNPGSLKTGNSIIGNPTEAKYGLTRPQIIEAYKRLKKLGVKRFGLHTMVASNELEEKYFAETAKILFDLSLEIKKKLDIDIEFVNLGGGFGIPYKPEQKKLNVKKISEGIRKEFEKIIVKNDLMRPKIFLELGRFITGPYGYLVTRAIHSKDTYKKYIGVDACMANLMRPGMYEAYHHITVLGKEKKKPTMTYDVVGSLCENNDKFAIDRKLPKIDSGDIVIIHDSGAHGHSMGFNYNGKLRSAELLLTKDRKVKMIRRAETLNDLFATLNLK